MGTEKISFKVRCRVDAVKPKPNVHSTSRHTVSTVGNAADHAAQTLVHRFELSFYP